MRNVVPSPLLALWQDFQCSPLSPCSARPRSATGICLIPLSSPLRSPARTCLEALQGSPTLSLPEVRSPGRRAVQFDWRIAVPLPFLHAKRPSPHPRGSAARTPKRMLRVFPAPSAQAIHQGAAVIGGGRARRASKRWGWGGWGLVTEKLL